MISRKKTAQGWQSEDMTESWMVTFSDLLTLLVTLFVLLLSMSSLKQGLVDKRANTEWDPGLATTLHDADLSILDEKLIPVDGIGVSGARITQLRHGLNRAGMTSGFNLYHDRRGTVLRFAAPVMVGRQLSAAGTVQLSHLAGYLRASGQGVTVSAVAGKMGSWYQAEQTVNRVANRLMEAGAAPDQVVLEARSLIYPDHLIGANPQGDVVFVFSD